MILYSTHCPKCIQIENIFNKMLIEYTLEDNIDTITKIAEENNINTVPFADIKGLIYNTKQLQTWLQERK